MLKLIVALLLVACSLAAPSLKAAEKVLEQKAIPKDVPNALIPNVIQHAPHTIVGSQLDTEDWQPPTIYTTMKIGTPGTSFTLQIDLYFENMLLTGPKCNSLSCHGVNNNRTIYDPTKSSSSKDQGDPVKERYGTPVNGEYYSDNIAVDSISDTDVAFAVLSSASQQYYRVNVDGVFGLSFLGNPRGKKNFDSPVNSILKGADQKIVSLWFNKATSNDDRYGTVTFGKLNTDKCNSDIQYLLVSDDDFSFRVQKIRFGKLVAHRELSGRIDPQQRMIGLPTTIYNDLLRVAGATAGTNSVSCSSVKDIKLEIKIGGNFYSLDNSDFVVKQSSSSSYCTLLIQDNGDEFDTGYVLGEPFFRRNCITYDIDNSEIGFSAAK
ncbi:Eukaryotic aspartyl protease [Aphelenchoides bicaudatus]|nr:Eukaryotic aspartyl protease [Aphelenchoides bicaudatus]